MKSRLKTMYNTKKASTSSNFFKPKRTPYGLGSFMTKYTMQERSRHDPQSITVEQYFVEMEQRISQQNGKRAVSTALPACRQHQGNRDHSGECKANRVVPEYQLGPVQLTRVNPLRPKYNGPRAEEQIELKAVCELRQLHEAKNEIDEVQRIKIEQQSYHDARPDSRYNKESICSSLDAMIYKFSHTPMLTSWNKKPSHNRNIVKQSRTNGQY